MIRCWSAKLNGTVFLSGNRSLRRSKGDYSVKGVCLFVLECDGGGVGGNLVPRAFPVLNILAGGHFSHPPKY